MKRDKPVQMALFTSSELGEPRITVHAIDDMPLLSEEDKVNVEKSKYVLPDKRFRHMNPMVEAYGSAVGIGRICRNCESMFRDGGKAWKCSKRGLHSGDHRLNWPACVKYAVSGEHRRKQDELNYQLAETALEHWKSKLGQPGWDDKLIETEIAICDKMLKELPKPKYKYTKGC